MSAALSTSAFATPWLALTSTLQRVAGETQVSGPLVAPDSARPDWIFRDGGAIYCVSSFPVCVPTWGTRGSGIDIESALLLVVLTHVRRALWRVKDDRWKVAVSRRRPLLGFWRTVTIEFFETQEQSEPRQVEIVRHWSDGQFEAAEPLGRSERRRRRLATIDTSAPAHP
jgi:hypothetical protein